MDSETEIEQQACKFEHILSAEATDKDLRIPRPSADLPAWLADPARPLLRA